jgi:hypothetical protein
MCDQLALLSVWFLSTATGVANDSLLVQDVSQTTGIAATLETDTGSRPWRYAHGAGWGDINGDGRPELYVGAFAARPWYRGPAAPLPNTLFFQGPEGFTADNDPVLRFAARDARCSGVLFADLDNDGDLDLVVANHVLRPDNQGSRLFANDGSGRFRDVTPRDACWPARRGVRTASVLDLNNDGYLDLILTDNTYGGRVTGENKLYVLQNRGEFRFRDAAAEFGFPQSQTNGLGLAVGDVNEDGVTDIFVAGCNRLFVSGTGGRYRESQPGRFVIPPADTREGHHCGAAFGDVNGDGLLDLITAEHGVPARLHLWLNQGVERGDPDLVQVSQSAGIGDLFPPGTRAEPIKCAHVALIDMDNDGRRDIVLSVIYRDDQGRVQPVVLRNLTRQTGNLKFSAPPFEKMIGYYAAAPATDFDGDGRIDMFLASWFEHLPNRLFRNVSVSGNWLTVRVDGREENLNSMGVGAVVRIYAAEHLGDPAHLLGRHDIAIGTGYASGDEAVAHFGLGRIAQCDVEVRWGKRRLCRGQVAANQALTLQLPATE